MKFRLNKLPRHANFEYRPRFYDPDKEQRERRRADYSEGDVAATLKSQIARGFDRRSGRTSQFAFRTQRSQQSAASNRRLLVIIAAMAIAAYFVLESNVEGLLAALR